MRIYVEIEPGSRIDQGDVFIEIRFPAIEATVNAVTITPTCDIEQGKATFLKFVSTVPLYTVVRVMADSVGIPESIYLSTNPPSKRQFDNLVKAIRHNTTGDFLPRFFLIPELPGILPASYLDLQRVFTVPFVQAKQEYMEKRVARIGSPWREQILTRYAGYSSRVGVPDYSAAEVADLVLSAGITLPYA